MSRKEKKAEKLAAKEAKREAKANKPKKRRFIKWIVLAIIIIIVIACCVSIARTDYTPDPEAEVKGYCEEVQEGYLGIYNTVEVGDMLEYVYPNGEWNYGTSNEGDYYVIEYTDDDLIRIQFKVDPSDEEVDFSVLGYAAPSADYEYSTEEAIAALHTLYWAYAEDNENTGIDTSGDGSDESVLIGHWGPVEEVVVSEDEDLSAEEEVEEEDLSVEEETTDEEELDMDNEGMTDEEILEALAEDGYDTYTSVDELRNILYEFDTNYTEDEITAMTNEEVYWEFLELMFEYEVREDLGLDEGSSTTTVTNKSEFDNWYRTAAVGDSVTIENVYVLQQYNRNDGKYLYCYIGVNQLSRLYVKYNDTGIRYMSSDCITVTGTLSNGNSSTPTIAATSITIQ